MAKKAQSIAGERLRPIVRNLWLRFYPDYEKDAFEQQIASLVKPEMNVLEIGAGSGRGHQNVFHLRGSCARYAGVDLDPRVLENLHLDEAFVADAAALPFEDQSFDLLREAATLEHATPRESLLREEFVAMAEHNQRHGAVDVAALLRNLAMRLQEYCGEGTYAYLLGRETTVPADSPLVVFDTRRCATDVLGPVMFALMEYVTHTVEQHWATQRARSTGAGAPLFAGRSIMLIDEAWHIVGRAQTGEYANDLARRARHLGLVLIVMSQQLSDFDTEHGLALLQNSTMQMLLAQPADGASQ